MEPPPSLSVSDWADTFCQLPSDSAEPGRYKTSRVEYMRAVMDAFTQSDVHKIIVKSSSQVGKSAVLLNIVGRTAHLDPANIEDNLKTLRERAHDLSINSALGAAVIETFVSGTIGSGLKVFPKVKAEIVGCSPAQARVLNQQIKREFDLWASEPLHCDFLRRNNFYELQQILFRCALIDGDAFVLFRRRIPTAYNPYSLTG